VQFTIFFLVPCIDKLATRALERSVSGAKNGAAGVKKSRERSGAVSGSRKNERSGARSGRSWSGSGAVSGYHRNGF